MRHFKNHQILTFKSRLILMLSRLIKYNNYVPIQCVMYKLLTVRFLLNINYEGLTYIRNIEKQSRIAIPVRVPALEESRRMRSTISDTARGLPGDLQQIAFKIQTNWIKPIS